MEKESVEKSCEREPRPRSFKEFLMSRSLRKSALALIIGGIIGYLYYHFAGESVGTSTFTRTPVMSILSGSFLGLFFVNRPCKSC